MYTHRQRITTKAVVLSYDGSQAAQKKVRREETGRRKRASREQIQTCRKTPRKASTTKHRETISSMLSISEKHAHA